MWGAGLQEGWQMHRRVIADDVDDEHREAQERSAGDGTSDGCDRKYHHRYGVDDYYNIATQGAAQE